MPGSDDAGEIILGSSDDEDGVAGDEKGQQVLFEETFAINAKKKAQHTRFVSDSSSGCNEGRKSQSSDGCASDVEEDDDADFVIDTATSVPKFSEDDNVMLDTNFSDRTDEQWPDAPNGDSISLNCVLTTDSAIASSQKESGLPKRRPIECFNCGGPHMIGKCPEPRDHARIARAMRQQRMNRTPDVGRYHDAGDADLASRFRAGIISPELADALSLRRNELPEWIYRMRKLGFIKGYPPGYLKQATVSEREATSDVLQFHCDQPVDGESRETDEQAHCPSRIDSKKVIYYFGFNKAAREGTRDREASWYSVPSFEAFVNFHQEDLNRQHEMAQRAFRQKRHHQGDDQTESSPSKKPRKKQPVAIDMDVSSDDEPTTSGGLLPPPPLPPTEYDALTEEELEQLLAKKQREMADMDEIGSPEPEDSPNDAIDTPMLIPTGDGARTITPPSVERRFVRHASSRSLDVMIGTPLGAPQSALFKPSLDDFSKGIVPFSAKEEAPVAHKGFFKRMLAKLKGVSNKKLPKTPSDDDIAIVPRLDKRHGSRQRKKKN